MSFGASPSDIIIVETFCRALYHKCRDAGGEYDEIGREVRALHTVLRHLKYEVEAPASPLNRDPSIWGRQLAPIVGDCDFGLRKLDGLLQKMYGKISTTGDRSPSSPGVLLDKVKFGSNEMDQLGDIRVKLISHKASLTLLLDTIQLRQSGKVATALDNHGGQLDVILDKVDVIAARMGQGSRSIMTSYDDDKEVWKQFRRELVAEGFSSDILTQHKDVLRAYIREIDQKGLLEEMPPGDPNPSTGVNAERWFNSVPPRPAISTKDVPPSSESLNTSTDDVVSPKEMVVRENNMKFPQSMKLARPMPETKRDEEFSNQIEPPNQIVPLERSISGGEQSRAPALPQLMAPAHKEPLYDTDGSCDEDAGNESERDDSRALIIRTSDLTTPGTALQLRPTGSPVSFRSYSSFGNDDAALPIASRPKNPKFATSPLLPRAIPIPIPARNLDPLLVTSPRPEPIRLAPDQYGNEILPDAKWTKIKRSLVSPAVLDQDGRRRPDFVAVLGVLSRAEIEHYATLSQKLRASRQRRSMRQQPIPPTRPPRPTLVHRPSNRHGRDTPSSDSSTSSSSTSSSSDSESHHRRRRRYKKRSSAPRQGYPNPFGQAPPPSPLQSPVFTTGSGEQTPRSGVYNSYRGRDDRDKDRDRDRDRDRDSKERRRHSSHTPRPSSSNSKSGNQREREKGARDMAKSRWRENLTAAGIGGAAVSLLNVLTEAAAEL